MPHRNRVTPEGEIVAHPGRGLFMGNRGILHDGAGRIVRTHASRAWITCLCEFKGRTPPEPLVSPGHYTRLFFLDEAVAFAAGHRPCAECRRGDYERFRAAWTRADLGRDARAPAIDRVLHTDRIEPRSRRKTTYEAEISGLPDGTFIVSSSGPALIRGGVLSPYSPGGYGAALPRPAAGPVAVLTPAPLVAVLAAGYRPVVHPTATGSLGRVR